MFSDKAMNCAEACRFCWMCRHACPVAQRTGREVHTPRARGLLVSMARRGFPLDADGAADMYACLLCGACTNDCATGYEPPVYIREARTEALLNGIAPEPVTRLIDRILETGNMFAEPGPGVALPNARPGAKLLMWLGATARHRAPEIALALAQLLDRAGVEYAVLEREPDSGVALSDLMGFVEDARARAADCARAIRETGAETVVALDSYDAEAFLHRYADWGLELPRVVTATALLAELTAAQRLRFRGDGRAVTYHDPCRLARELDELAPARSLLAAAGHPLREMFLNGRRTRGCGNALVDCYDPALVKRTSAGRWEDALRTGAEVLVTACPQAWLALSRAKPEGMELRDLFGLLRDELA